MIQNTTTVNLLTSNEHARPPADPPSAPYGSHDVIEHGGDGDPAPGRPIIEKNDVT